MAWTKFLTQDVQILRRSVYQSTAGEESQSWALFTTVKGMLQQMRGRWVVGDSGGHTIAQWLLFLLPGTDIHTGDRVIVDGVTYNVFLDHTLRYMTAHHMEVIVDKTFIEVNP